jgi:hypothetical protein
VCEFSKLSFVIEASATIMSHPSTTTDASVSGRPAAAFNEKRSHQGNGNGNYNYNDSNPVNPDASAQHREYARSSPSSQLPSLTSANPNGPASQNSVLQTPQNLVEFNNECLLAYNKYLIPNSEFARVHQ